MVSERRSRIFNGFVAIGVVALLAFSWYIYLQNVKLRRFAAELLRAREYPFVVTGLKVDILAESKLLEKWPPGPERKPLQALVIATSDTCGYCRENLPRWEKLLAGLQLRDSQEVWVLTMDTAERAAPLIRRMRAGRIPYRILAVKDPLFFSLKTGLVGVPTTLVLGEGSAVELICHGQVGERETQVILDFVNGKATPKRPFLVSADRRTSALY
jgi:hypothetical protein